MLILGRAVLGFGAAGLLQGALGIVAFIVKLEKVPMYQGMVAAAAAVSATAGPVIGGGLTDHMNWSSYSHLLLGTTSYADKHRMVLLDVRVMRQLRF